MLPQLVPFIVHGVTCKRTVILYVILKRESTKKEMSSVSSWKRMSTLNWKSWENKRVDAVYSLRDSFSSSSQALHRNPVKRNEAQEKHEKGWVRMMTSLDTPSEKDIRNAILQTGAGCKASRPLTVFCWLVCKLSVVRTGCDGMGEEWSTHWRDEKWA
jgi:hypothetical protein